MIVANDLTAFDPNRALPSFYNEFGNELYFINADITTTAGSDYTTYSYIVDAGENHSGLAAGYWSDTTDISELLTQSYDIFYLNWNVTDEFDNVQLLNAYDNIHIDNVKIMEKSNVIPEPATLAYAAMGLSSIAGVRRFKK